MELKNYVLPLRKWWWLLTAATLIAAASTFLATLGQPQIYRARTTLMIGRTINDPNPSSSEFILGQQLAATYADIANRELVRNTVMKSLGLNGLPEYIAQNLPNTQLIEIVVNDVDPRRAQAVANELAAQLVLLSPTSARPEEQSRQEFVNEQLNNLETQIEDTQNEIEKLQGELGNLVSAREIADSQSQVAALQSKLTTLQGNYASLLSNTQQGAINTLTVIEPADLPSQPIGSNKTLTVFLASAIALVLAGSAAYLLEYLDDSLKSPEEIERLFQSPIIGRIVEEVRSEVGNQLYITKKPRHPIAEAFRTLRANLEFSGIDKPFKTILVASAESEDGKTWVAANLAVALAQQDKKVVLVDADFRRPSVHKFFNIQNEPGLIDVFLGRQSVGDVLKFKKTDNVTIITSGDPPPNPAELLSSKKMDQILAKLGEFVDTVIIDGPPFGVADAPILASKVDAVLAVVRSGHTHKKAAEAMIDQINMAGGRLLGVIINRIPRRDASIYYGSYYVYSAIHDSKKQEKTSKIGRTPLRQNISSYVQNSTHSVAKLFRSVLKLILDKMKRSILPHEHLD